MMKQFWFTMIIIHIFVVIGVQICLNVGGTRETFTSIDSLEGIARTEFISFITPCEVELEVSPFDPDNKLKILINGRISAFFTEPKVRVAVKSSALIEIDAMEEDRDYVISVCGASTNVDDGCFALQTITGKNISILGKIFAN